MWAGAKLCHAKRSVPAQHCVLHQTCFTATHRLSGGFSSQPSWCGSWCSALAIAVTHFWQTGVAKALKQGCYAASAYLNGFRENICRVKEQKGGRCESRSGKLKAGLHAWEAASRGTMIPAIFVVDNAHLSIWQSQRTARWRTGRNPLRKEEEGRSKTGALRTDCKRATDNGLATAWRTN